MQTNNHVLLVDLSHLIYRSVCIPQLAKLHTKNNIPTGGIYGVLQSIYKCLENDTSITSVYLLKDGYSKWRKDLFPDYKANREANPASPYYKSYIEPNSFGWSKKDTLSYTGNKLDTLATYLGMRIVFDEYSEADDLAYLMAQSLYNNGVKLTFLTSDRDWLQLIKIFPGVNVFDGIKNETYNVANFKEYQGYDPEWFHFQKAMLGDKSDNIPSVLTGLGEKGVLKLIDILTEQGIHPDDPEFQNKLLSVVQNLDASTLGRFKAIKTLDTEALSVYDRNIKLVDFRQCPHSQTLLEQVGIANQAPVSVDFQNALTVLQTLELNQLSKVIMPGSPFYRLS